DLVQISANGRRYIPRRSRHGEQQPRPHRVDIEVQIRAVELHTAFAGQTHEIAKQFQLIDLHFLALNAEFRMAFFEGGAVRRTQFQELEQIEQQRKVVNSAMRDVDRAAAAQRIEVIAPAGNEDLTVG